MALISGHDWPPMPLQTLSMMLNHMEMRCRKQNLTAQMSLVLACMRRRLKALPKHEHVTPADWIFKLFGQKVLRGSKRFGPYS